MTIGANTSAGIPRRLRLGMVGGGQGAFIGAVHRIAARIDDAYELVAGALSSDPERARISGAELGLAPERAYTSYEGMARAESRRPDGIDAVAIVTPNHMHFPIAKTFLEAGIHVICDKPLTSTLEDALALQQIAEGSGKLFVLTHNYTGYPMIRQARAMIAEGAIGKVRVVQAEYLQGWLATRVEDTGSKQAGWRTDPAKSGAGGCIGDIGTHAFNLAGFVTGLEVETLSADLSTFVEGRRVDDHIQILLRYAGGAKGTLVASQVAIGSENGLKLRIYGETGGLEWVQEEPNQLWYTPLGEAKRLLTRGGAGAGPAANRVTRVPFGHPEGYLEGFANIYVEAARAIRAFDAGTALDPDVAYPTIADGVAGMRFIDAAIRSAQADGRWTPLVGIGG
ncbi:Gfo/Idh/MocA family protein [Methylobrevis albus]|uniref:Gfo/Idh/MocA family oxidoreductase n=1 Tax=Methylobrevis albus TaxID=2793297 RepID=A0A931I1H7_9HYPH|nr:Gfo/Idh/MocA family oxidoreductase [Methylobrevis albus]MBH0237659.1 Gfo/Idh/MocA family oxidoreductase [Methylobrevis albus]